MFHKIFKTSAKRLSNKHSKIMADFAKPLANLQKLHDQHEAHHERVSNKILKLAEEEKEVVASKETTKRMINKFQSFLND